MKIQTKSFDDIDILELSGRFDAYEEPQVRRWLAETTSARKIINLGGVNFIDSTALATLVQGMKRCREQNGDLHLCNLQQPIRIIFELTRLDRAFDIYPHESEAAAAFSA
jgi:anti-sigma B factor antagonist